MTVTSNATASRRTPAGNFVQRCCLLGTVAVLSLAAFGAIAQTPAQAPAQAPERAGIAAGVAGKVQISEGARTAPEAVKTGMDVLMRDRVQSENAGRMQVLLMDETVFTIGPNSDLVIDEFVYDPSTGAGKVTANFTKGMLRYVSGKVAAANPAGVTIRTATATIGVRGTSLFIVDAPAQGAEGDETDEGTQFIGLLGPGNKNDGNLKAGGLTVTGGGVSVDVLRAGNGVFTTPGQPVGPVVPTPPEILQLVANGMTGQLPSEGGAAGGGEGEGESEEGEGDSSASESSGSDTANAGASAGDVAAVAGALGDTGSDATKAVSDAASDEAVDEVEDSFNESPLVICTTCDITTSSSISDIVTRNTSGLLPDLTDEVTIPALVAATWSTEGDLTGQLDLWLTGPTPAAVNAFDRFFVTWKSDGDFEGAPFFAALDIDNSTGGAGIEGEIIGISQFNPGGPYRAILLNYGEATGGTDNSPKFSNPANDFKMFFVTGGTLQRGPGGTTIIDGQLVKAITPPASSAGHTWYGFDIDPVTMAVTVISAVNNNHTDGLGVPLDGGHDILSGPE